MGKIMDKLKHSYNAFPEPQTQFIHKECVTWSFLPSFKEFRHSFYIFKISGTSNEEKSYNRLYLPLSFANCHETSPKLVYSYQTSGRVMHAKFQLISMQSAKVLNEDREHIKTANGRPNG